MRKSRCTKCGTTFYTADPKITECQNCTGTLPDKTEQLKAEAEAKVAIVNPPLKDEAQTFPISELAEDKSEDTPKPKRKRRQTVKQKDLKDASAG